MFCVNFSTKVLKMLTKTFFMKNRFDIYWLMESQSAEMCLRTWCTRLRLFREVSRKFILTEMCGIKSKKSKTEEFRLRQIEASPFLQKCPKFRMKIGKLFSNFDSMDFPLTEMSRFCFQIKKCSWTLINVFYICVCGFVFAEFTIKSPKVWIQIMMMMKVSGSETYCFPKMSITLFKKKSSSWKMQQNSIKRGLARK